MKLNKGDVFRINGDEHMIDGIDNDDIYVERLKDNSLVKYDHSEVVALIIDSRKKGWYTGPWPITINTAICGVEYPFEEQLLKLGISESDRFRFKFGINPQLECMIELHHNGNCYLIAINGVRLQDKIKTN